MPSNPLEQFRLAVASEVRIGLLNPRRNPQRIHAAREVGNLGNVASEQRDCNTYQAVLNGL